MNYGNGLRLSKDLNSKLELYIDSHAGLEYWGSTEGEKYLGLSTNIANFIGLINNSGLTLKLDDGQNKLNIDIDKLKERLYDVLGDNLIYDSTTKKLDVKNYETVSILKGKSLIEDHSITYLNLQDRTGIKFDSNNKVIEMMNYRNKIFEYKRFKFIKNDEDEHISHNINNKNPNESYLYFNYAYFKSSIIEDYRVTIFIIKKNISNLKYIFRLYNNDESLTILKAFIYNENNKKKYNLLLQILIQQNQ